MVEELVKGRVFASRTDAIWTADLVDIQSIAKSNKGYKYILMIINVFSKYGLGYPPLKTNTRSEVAEAFQDLWKRQAPPPQLWTDKCKGFYNKQMKDILEKNNVSLYTTENKEKLSVVERCNPTINVEVLYSKQHNNLQCVTGNYR